MCAEQRVNSLVLGTLRMLTLDWAQQSAAIARSMSAAPEEP